MILEQLGARIEKRRADGQSLALVFVDCGIVGEVDDVWGRSVGDAVRARFGSMLRSEVLRQDDLLLELSRDEMACVLDPVQSPGVALLAAEKILRALDEPVWLGEDQVYARPAIGVALFPEHGDAAAPLLQHARIACRFTRHRPERITVYAEAQGRPEAEHLRYANRLRAAIAGDGLELVFRPRVEFRSSMVTGAECTLRWSNGDHGLVPVETAFAAAEPGGLASRFTEWMLNGALRDCGEFRQSGGLDLRVGVNLPAKYLRDRDLPEFVARALGTWGLRAGRLVIQITDSGVLQGSGKAQDTFMRLKAVGVRLSIADGGAGYSALAHLATLPFHEIKIPSSCVREMLNVPQHLSVVRSLIELAHGFKLEVVADGVENEALAARLKELGCDYMMGSHVGPPLDTAGFIKNLGNR
ncbi:MAG: putative bifunctional diguanylate cyclase/phosphodiesterase [Burkholderiales bacterium]